MLRKQSNPTLKDFEGSLSIKVLRDGSFRTLGFLSDPQPGMIVFLEDEKYLDLLRRTPGISCVITTGELAEKVEHIPGVAVSADPKIALFELHNHLALKTDFYWNGFPTEIDRTASVHPRACIAENSVRIGANTIIGANVTISERCLIGSSVTILAGAVLGSAGFQSAVTGNGTIDMVHAGGIVIQDKVVIYSNAVIAAAVFRQFTTIGEDSRIGNVAFVSHNVQVGSRCLIGHGSVINGNVRLGSDVWIGPGATLTNNIALGDGAQVSLGATVTIDVRDGERVTGMLAMDHNKMLCHIRSLKEKKDD